MLKISYVLSLAAGILFIVCAFALFMETYYPTQKKPCQPLTFIYDTSYSFGQMECEDFRHSLRVKEYTSTSFRVYCDCPDKKVIDEMDAAPKSP